MARGFRGEGIHLSARMIANATITKGDVVAFDVDGWLVKAPANEKNPIGVAAETKTSAAGENPHLAYVKHGVAGVKATTAVSAGDAVKVSGTAGEVAKLDDQAVNEGGAAAYTIYRNEKLGRALQDIAAGAEGDVFVGGA